MYHHHSQQLGPQPFSNGPRLPHHQPQNLHQNQSPCDMLSQVIGFQFPRPTQLPDELESALSIRCARDMDHRLIDHMNQSNQNQNQGSGAGICQHGNYSANPVTLSSNHQPVSQGVDWSGYQPPTKLFASAPPSANHQSQRHKGPQQQPQSRHTGAIIPSWTAPVSDSPSSQARHLLGAASGSVDGQSLYTPESAGSILASFGLSNEDLEVLSHYPDDQLTPDTLPFILRDIQINKSGNQKTVASTSSSSFSHNIHDVPLPTSHSSPLEDSQSPEIPSLLTVTQTAGKVIDYGHASRANEESSTRETFKRELLSSERTVKMYPSSSSSSSAAKVDKTERRQVNLEHTEPSKHGDQDYRRTCSDHRKSSQSPVREFPSSKARNLDKDYRRDRPKPRPSSETRSEDCSRRSASSLLDSKPVSSGKKIPTPTMISDFSAVSPKVYPHTCSLCHTQCDQEKDWVDHINTVNHTAACRDLRNKYPDWKPNVPSRSGRYGSWALWDPRDGSPSHSISRSLSCSPPSSPPHSKHKDVPHRTHRRPYSPHGHPRHHHYTEHRFEYHYSGPRTPSQLHQTTTSHTRDHRCEKRDRESSGTSSRNGVKHPYDDAARYDTETNRHPSSSKNGSSQSITRTVKSGTKTGPKSAKSPQAKKKKKVVTQPSQEWFVADHLVYLTGIPNDASEQEVTDLVGSFGKINNVILMPCSEQESEKNEGQKASVCMVRAEDAQALADSTNLFIRDQQITASVAKKPDGGHFIHTNNSKPGPEPDKGGAGKDLGGEADQKTSDEKGMVLITGLPESDWSESDIIKLVQPFGTPSDIIIAAEIGKVLMSVPDIETAQGIVKVHTFMPAKIKDSEVKMIHLKQRIGLSTPVALYNLLVGSVDPLERPPPVTWSSLLVISNVPETPSASSEVQKLVRRFGTVIKTLVLKNMVICEMATAAMALSVYKRFQTFPCIIQNNPLFFSRKPDPKAQAKVIAVYADLSEVTPTNVKSGQTAVAANKAETSHEENAVSHWERIEKDDDRKNENMNSTEKTADEDKTLEENRTSDSKVKKDKLSNFSNSLAAHAKPEQDMDGLETSEEEKRVRESGAGNDTPVKEETKPYSSDGKAALVERDVQEVTPEMVNALIVECRTRIDSQPNNRAASGCREQQETQMETQQSKDAAEETKEQAKSHTEEEEKRQERTERQARKEKETKERERREKERRAWEKVERAKRERERDERSWREWEKREEERREWKGRERERRERKRAYGEGFPGSGSFRSKGYKQSSWRDEDYKSSKPETEMVDEEEVFPLNMSDFVTVDEVGDVTELPSSPSPTVPMETTEGGEDGPTSVQLDTAGDISMEVSTDRTSDTTETQVKPDEQVPHIEPVSELTTETAAPLSPEQSCTGQTVVPTCQLEAAETEITCLPETTPIATLDFTADIEHPSVSALPEVSSASPRTEVATADREENAAMILLSQAEEEMVVVSDKTEEQEKMQDEEEKETKTLAAVRGKHKKSEDQTNAVYKSVKKELKAETSMSYILPPFDPSNPVGMEFLVPKTGFFCKVCNRFFSGNKEAEINHCKTAKHYENLQKYLQTMKT
ncbi:zinc finger protein 638-like isoform X2 [Anabas testudineus]|uniref:zinc finger protein 638-like isoform X2 n=1 Tax=Anabas testudineus TaxID=64144 RepID=UPI000E45F6B4|nr:zinc finger protein 638-like isoform X2 [Anabas testudineus]